MAARCLRRTALEYAAQMLQGLAAAHRKGVVHRDLKPENLWITHEGRVKILDFGLAKVDEPIGQSESGTLSLATDPGRIMGTVGYMSPEQVRGQPVDHRTDLFAFGAILHEMVAGQRAFYATYADRHRQRHPEPGSAGTGGPRHQPARAPLPGEGSPGAVFNRQTISHSRWTSFWMPLPPQPNRGSLHVPQAADRAIAALASPNRRLRGHGCLSDRGLELAPATLAPMAFRSSRPRITRLAVLPLTNLSNDAEQEYFADGMTDILIADLMEIGSLRVISRTSVMQFKGAKKSLPEIAKQLGVDAVVTASVMKSGAAGANHRAIGGWLNGPTPVGQELRARAERRARNAR